MYFNFLFSYLFFSEGDEPKFDWSIYDGYNWIYIEQLKAVIKMCPPELGAAILETGKLIWASYLSKLVSFRNEGELENQNFFYNCGPM